MTTIEELAGSRIVDAGQKDPDERLLISEGRQALWLINGSAEWRPQSGRPMAMKPSAVVYELVGPGAIFFLEPSHYVWLQAWDELGFGPRAEMYRILMESRNLGVGQALAAALPVARGQIWVDIGTGTGAMVQALQERAAEPESVWILGIDRASRMIDQAWGHPKGGVPAWFVAQDLLALRWPQRMFDGVSALLLLHLVEDLDGLLGNVYTALKPGGLFVYAVSSDANPFVRMIMHQLAGPGKFFKQGQAKIRQSVLDAGFEIVRSETYRDKIVLDNPEAMIKLIASIGGPSNQGLREDVKPPRSIDRIFDLVWAQKPSNDQGKSDVGGGERPL